ncbi:hypothetical protein [Moraxella lacunata]|uniref:hypothetical protein n=1 Tax=Moraxella lacunata TaxID=477 RepID=UPI003EE09A79
MTTICELTLIVRNSDFILASVACQRLNFFVLPKNLMASQYFCSFSPSTNTTISGIFLGFNIIPPKSIHLKIV